MMQKGALTLFELYDPRRTNMAHVMTGDDALSKMGTKHAAFTCRPTRFLSFFGDTSVLSQTFNGRDRRTTTHIQCHLGTFEQGVLCGLSCLVVTRLPAAREGPGSNRAADKYLCFHENHCDTQLWARAAH